jgi:hypothetical protein
MTDRPLHKVAETATNSLWEIENALDYSIDRCKEARDSAYAENNELAQTIWAERVGNLYQMRAQLIAMKNKYR